MQALPHTLGVLACIGGALIAAPVAGAAFPGSNGKIAYQSNGDVISASSDGSGKASLADEPGSEREPAWSADGTKIAFVSEATSPIGVYVMDANGGGKSLRAAGGTLPAWSPDGSRIAFVKVVSSNHEIFVMNADGTGQTNITNHPAASDLDPAWSPDGTAIAFTRGASVMLMNPDGTNVRPLTANAVDPSWAPSGQKLAVRCGGDICLVNADGTGKINITNTASDGEGQPAFSPDGTKIAFTTDRISAATEVFVMDADGSDPVNVSNNGTFGAVDSQPDWQPLPLVPPSSCGNTLVQVNRATVEGNLTETNPGSGVFKAGPGQVVYVGGFELRPRFGGTLVVDSGAGTLTEEGTGVQVMFGRFDLPLNVASIPVSIAEATVPINRTGTLLKALFSLPISGQIKVSWADGGKSAGLEFELEVDKLLGNFGTFDAAGLTKPSLKLKGRQVNCTGFDFTSAEVRADEISFVPTALKKIKKLGLRNVLFKYEDRGGRDFFAGQGEVILPTGTGSLATGGKLSVFDSKLAGIGISVSGINRPVGYGLFLQAVSGEMAFEPSIGGSFGVEGTLGPQVGDKKLVKLAGNLKFLSLASECRRGDDPISLVATGTIPVVEDRNAGKIKLDVIDCIYTDSLAMEQSVRLQANFGEVVGQGVPNPVAVVNADVAGFVSEAGLSAEGGATITIPLVGGVQGRALLSTRAIAGCGRVGFFSGGVVHVWGQSRTEVFSHCDLAQWQLTANASVSATARAAATVNVKGSAPLVGFSARGTDRPPRIRVRGPGGVNITARSDRARIGRSVVTVPVAAEDRTFVFVRAPKAGRWRVDAVGGDRIRQLRTTRGLPQPRITGVVTRVGQTTALEYRVRQIGGQQVTFVERTDDGVVKEIGRARSSRGRIPFTPASTGQAARIEAIVVQDGAPRDVVKVADFRAPSPYALAPARPARLKAVRRGRGLLVSWARVSGAPRYRVDVLRGTRRVARRTTTALRVRLARVPRAQLRVQVRALSTDGAASAPRAVSIKRLR